MYFSAASARFQRGQLTGISSCGDLAPKALRRCFKTDVPKGGLSTLDDKVKYIDRLDIVKCWGR